MKKEGKRMRKRKVVTDECTKTMIRKEGDGEREDDKGEQYRRRQRS